MSESSEAQMSLPSADQVAEFLKQNPFFFCERDDLLLKLKIPHLRGSAVSLVERQVSVLRERNLEMRQRLSNLLDIARENDRLFEQTRHLVLQLLECRSLNQVGEKLRNSLLYDFGIDFASLIIFSDTPLATHARVEPPARARERLGTLLSHHRSICGRLQEAQLAFLFPDQCADIGSAAVVPLEHQSARGVLAIASRDPNFYHSSLGTLFLNHIGDVLSRILARHLPR